MKTSFRGLRESFVKATLSALISGPLTFLGMNYYAALTVSTDPTGIVPTMAQGATIIASGLVFTAVFISNYLNIELEK